MEVSPAFQHSSSHYRCQRRLIPTPLVLPADEGGISMSIRPCVSHVISPPVVCGSDLSAMFWTKLQIIRHVFVPLLYKRCAIMICLFEIARMHRESYLIQGIADGHGWPIDAFLAQAHSQIRYRLFAFIFTHVTSIRKAMRFLFVMLALLGSTESVEQCLNEMNDHAEHNALIQVSSYGRFDLRSLIVFCILKVALTLGPGGRRTVFSDALHHTKPKKRQVPTFASKTSKEIASDNRFTGALGLACWTQRRRRDQVSRRILLPI